MKTVVLIGAGQLGSRHLQSLSLLDINVKIQVVDPYEESLKISKERFEQMPNNPLIKVEYFLNINDIDVNIDLCIVATTSNVRADIIKILVGKKNIRKFILEKVLFQKLSEYDEIQQILKNKNIDCWVNHPFRCYPIYKELKKYFSSFTPVTYHVSGGDWGLGCNGLHYIDHLAFLTNSYDLNINTDFLDKVIIDSKRNGFKEFSGRLIGSLGDNNFILQCDKYYSPLTITIQNENIKIILDEVSGWLKIAKKENNWKWENFNEKIMFFQSELTNIVATEIFKNNDCDLPTFEMATNLHKSFIEGLLRHLNKVENKTNDICPIT